MSTTTTAIDVETQTRPSARLPRRHVHLTPRRAGGQILLYAMLAALALVYILSLIHI